MKDIICPNCQKPLAWIQADEGAYILVDKDSVPDNKAKFDPRTMIEHREVCARRHILRITQKILTNLTYDDLKCLKNEELLKLKDNIIKLLLQRANKNINQRKIA